MCLSSSLVDFCCFFLLSSSLLTASHAKIPTSYKVNDNIEEEKFPVYHTISPYDDPVLFVYKGIDRFSFAGIQKAWNGIQWNLSEYESLSIGFGEDREKLIESMSSKAPEKEEVYVLTHSPYKDVLVAVSTKHRSSELKLSIKSKILFYLPLMTGVGLLLFLTAKHLSRSVTLYYGGGMTIGILASVLILLYIFSKFVPKKNILGLGIFAGGWTLFGTALYWFADHLKDGILQYWSYFLIYTVVAAVISLAFLYWWGPITNERTFDLIQWALQLVALGIVYCSTQMYELSIALCVCILLFYNLPKRFNPLYVPMLMVYYVLYTIFFPLILIYRCLSYINPFYSLPKKKLLTKEEYEEQGRVETEKALLELRNHVQDLPTREAVGVMSKLNSSSRFSKFLNGSEHISSEEQVTHYWAYNDSDSSSEEDDESGRTSTPRNSSMSSSQYSYEDSPPRPHPSPSHAPFRSPSRTPSHKTPPRYKYTPNYYTVQ